MNNFDRIRQELGTWGLDAMLVTSPSNRKYAADFSSTAGMALVTKDKAYFFVDSRYIEAAKKEINGAEVEMTDANNPYEKKINAVIDAMGIKKLGVEDGQLSHADYLAYCEKLNADLTGAQGLLTALREVKNVEEYDSLIRAQRISEGALEQVLGIIKPGMTERRVAAELTYFMLCRGAENVSFEPIVVSGVKSSMPHGVPGDNVIKDGDFLTMDFGCKYNGYCSDMTRTVAIGSANDEMKKVYSTVLEAQTAAIAAARAGMTGAELDGIARDVIKAAGYGQYFGHGFGHGVGLDIHEAPTAGPSGKKPMPAGAVISAEPGIYLEGKFGVRIEDVIILHEDGCTNITQAPKQLIVL